jgi:cytochrome c oxidase cbb3-type subunit 1
MVLFVGAALWLLFGSLMALLHSVKLHGSALLASDPMLTYGRVRAVADTAVLYGFGIPAALGTGLWLLCRLGNTKLVGPMVTAIGALGWNAAVAAGVWAILRGGGSGYEAFEMPRAVAPLLLLSYILIGVCAIRTFMQRESGDLQPAQWFVFGALFWFAWIFSTAALLLLPSHVRGVLQASISWWYEHNLSTVFFGFAGLAQAFYFLPKLSGRPLYSGYQAAFGFWMLALVGSWGGFPAGAPLPGWMIAVSMVGTVLTIIPITVVALNLYLTVGEKLPASEANPTFRFIAAGVVLWVIAGVQQVAGALPAVAAITDYTWFTTAQHDLFRYGFVSLTMFGAIYYIIPRLADPASANPDNLWNAGLVKWHFRLTAIGVLLGYVSTLAAGLCQGTQLGNPANSFVAVMKSTMMPLRFAIFEPILLAAGTVLFLLNLQQLARRCCARCCLARKEAA